MHLISAHNPEASKEAELKTTQILAVFLSISAIALGLPAQASAAGELRSAGNEVAENLREGAAAVGEFAGDALITTKVKAAIVAHEDLKALEIGVKTIDNVVYLSGRTDTIEQREIAEQLTRDVDGVKSVVN